MRSASPRSESGRLGLTAVSATARSPSSFRATASTSALSIPPEKHTSTEPRERTVSLTVSSFCWGEGVTKRLAREENGNERAVGMCRISDDFAGSWNDDEVELFQLKGTQQGARSARQDDGLAEGIPPEHF